MAKEPLIRALRGEPVEQTPWLPHIGTHAAQLLEVSAERYLQDAELLARGGTYARLHDLQFADDEVLAPAPSAAAIRPSTGESI